MAEKIARRKRSVRKSATTRTTNRPRTGVLVPRSTSGYDEDDILLSGGGRRGAGYGRCGGRALSTLLEQHLCDQLSRHGVTHCHSPRHFEVRLGENRVGAYAPMVVLRGRGRQGKTVVIEAASGTEPGIIAKIQAFREQFGPEFYVILVAPEDVIDDIPLAVYDESCTTSDLNTLVSRLAE